ncbi:WecB/TagA/CpsF family glycosyltransferase [Candidatus Sumerlaeota bacterium]|nr:WecB/TagA/CpsF family glycosyltransferase [Candidatus Sumerlaeota bacterium]
MQNERQDTLVRIAGVPVTPLNLRGSLARLDDLINDGSHHFICFLEGNLFSYTKKCPELCQILCHSSMVLPDGVALMWLARLLRKPLPERVPGPTFLLAACEYGLERGYRHFFYGGGPGVAERLAGVLSQRYPGLRVVGYHSPPFRPLCDKEEREIKERIEAARPHLLWVGLGGPKQEFWMAEHVGKIDVPVMLGVGAAFDFHSGAASWAPRWIRTVGMEWAYRTLTGGKRVFLRNIRCVSLVALLIIREVWRERIAKTRS